MENKLYAIEEAMDYIKFAIREIDEYPTLSDLVCNLRDIKSDLMEHYREIEEEISEQEDIDLGLKLAYQEGRL